ncbi:tetratricopeptide repeat protein [[Eubacterium] cellulosolvens]
MKTCPMCGTLLFDDADTCTKCGNVMIEKEAPAGEAGTQAAAEPAAGAEGTAEASAAEAPPEVVEEPPAEGAPAEASEGAEGGDKGDISTTANQRKKWLEEQEKIKSELANIMGRVGRKKKPAFTPTVGAPPAQGIPPAANPAAPSAAAPNPANTMNPAPGANPNPATAQPPSAPVPGNQNMPQNISQPNTAPGGASPAQGMPPTPAPAAPSPSPASAPAGQGLSDVDKNELMGELDDLRNEGYNVSKLETIIEEDPANAWKAFSDFLDDIEKLNQLKSRLESCNIDGIPGLEAEKNDLLATMNDPDFITKYEGEVTQFENKLLAAKSKLSQEAVLQEEQQQQSEAQLAKLVEVGKEAFRVKNYEKALQIFTRADEISPNNKEIVFFKKKIETKLAEATGAPGAEGVAAEPVAPEETGGKKKKKKKKKKLVSRRATPSGAPAAVPGAGSMPGAAPAPGPPAQAPRPSPQQPPPQPIAPRAPAPAGAPGAEGDGPRTAAEFEALGFNAYINKDYPKALEFYQKVLEIDPSFPNVQNIIDECLMRLGKK